MIIRESDRLLDALERCRAANLRCIPPALVRALFDYLSQTEPDRIATLHRERRPEHLISLLYGIQGQLMEAARLRKDLGIVPLRLPS